ncbi:hypothetical protein E3E14_05865 [Streptomyces sp. ICN441]|uniref:hypothetical protein n=1 Tax=Streptomyces sp. ICN441 TaxID=2558286 RepID=UPI00106CD307|nr:hypothetical protein [Streptomyces sp. ICN441]TFE55348.1 hypothetical protein E3E14_05865 [Streptomyces sp. ICN441]
MPPTLIASHTALPRVPAVPLPKIMRSSGRSCPVCAEVRCLDADGCRASFDTFEWMDCPDCQGTGFDTTEFQIFCPVCGGAKVVEAGLVDTAGASQDVAGVAA